MITVLIDEITPCLKDMETGLYVDTEVVKISRKSILSAYNRQTGWYVDWKELVEKYEVYALTLAGTYDIQGLVALKDNKDPSVDATYAAWMVASPENNKFRNSNIKYSGVGGHLFAIAGNYSHKHGHLDDAVYEFAANQKLLNHYVNDYGAICIGQMHPWHFMILGDNIKNIEEVYNYDVSNI